MRLTIRNSDGSVSQPTTTTILDVFSKLAMYEDLEEQGRLIVMPEKGFSDKDGEKALRKAMYTCSVQNNPVTRYTADAIAEKLVREEAKAALEEGKAL